MRRSLVRLAGLLGLLLVFAVGLAWLAPATWVDRGLQQASRGALGLGAPVGTLWRGQGTLQAVLPAGRTVTLGPITWQVKAAELLRGRLRVLVRAAATGDTVLDAGWTPAGVEVHAARLEVPAALLGSLSATLREAELGGRLTLRSDGFAFRHGRFAGAAELEWQEAASSLVAVRPLGSYRLAMAGTPEGLDCRLGSLGEPALALTGRTLWQPGRPFRFEGSARPAPARARELAPLLRILGRETAPGTYRLEMDANVGVS